MEQEEQERLEEYLKLKKKFLKLMELEQAYWDSGESEEAEQAILDWLWENEPERMIKWKAECLARKLLREGYTWEQ